MKHIWECRRTGVAVLGMILLSIPLMTGKMDTSTALAAIAVGLAGSNAYEKKGKNNGPGPTKPRRK